MSNSYFVTGIGTGIGKTIVSAIITQKLQADYWKPIQSGDLESSDSLMVANLINNSKTLIHPERFRLSQPLSPHLSARIDGINLNVKDFQLPDTDNSLVIEGAGGLLVPLNGKELMLDLIKALKTKVIVVSKNYLGSINHTLLTLEALKIHQIPVAGIIFNGDVNQETERYILNYTGVTLLGRIPELQQVDKKSINNAGSLLTL